MTDSLTRPDEKSRGANYALALNNGWLSVNEVRAKEGLGPVEGGDVYRFPLNMGQQTPIDSKLIDPEKEPKDDKEPV